MMASKVGNITFKGGTYTNAQGEEKNRWMRQGVLFEKDGEFFGTLEFLGMELRFSVFPDRDKPKAAPQSGGGDDMPF